MTMLGNMKAKIRRMYDEGNRPVTVSVAMPRQTAYFLSYFINRYGQYENSNKGYGFHFAVFLVMIPVALFSLLLGGIIGEEGGEAVNQAFTLIVAISLVGWYVVCMTHMRRIERMMKQ